MLKPKLMLLPHSFPVALAMMLVCMVCWGSWTNTYRLARRWPLEFFHCDFAIGVFLAGVVAAVTFGTLFGRPDFMDNLRTADGAALAWAAAGGAAVNAGNLLLMGAIARIGMAIAFPIAVGTALVVSTVLSYLVRPVGDAVLLAAGVTLVFCAVVANALAYRSRESGGAAPRSRGGLAMCFTAALLFSAAGPLVAKAMATTQPLAPYGAGVFYGGGNLLITLPLLVAALRWPIGPLPFKAHEYLAGSTLNHFSGLAGGLIWGAGMVLAFAAANLAGMAISGAVGQANSLVAAVWGIFVWREFRGAPRRTHLLLALMMALYIAGLALLALSFRNV